MLKTSTAKFDINYDQIESKNLKKKTTMNADVSNNFHEKT